MAKRANTAAPATAPVAEPEAPKGKKPKAKARELVPVSAKAIQAGVGLEALRMVAQASQNESMIKQLRADNYAMLGAPGSQRGKAQVITAMGVYSAALADETIRQDLPKTWLDAKKNKADLNYLYARLRVALGMEDLKGRKTEEVHLLWDDIEGDSEAEAKRKESVRTKFAAILNKAAKVALDALDNGIELKVDKSTGFLQITDGKKGSGAVKQRYGQASVLLNEDQNVKVLDKKGQVTDKVIKLKALPSFSEQIREAGKAHNVVVASREDMRIQAMSTDKFVVETCKRLVTSIANIDIEKASKEVKDALNSVYNALDRKLT